METIGFIGLGTMGKPMASRLLEAGYGLVVMRSSKSAGDMAARGAQAVDSYFDLAAVAEVVILSLPDSSAVEAVIYDPGDLIEMVRPGVVLIDMGTSDPASTKRIAVDLHAKGAEMLDGPVSGGEGGAIKGTLSCMVGGSQETLEKVSPLLRNLAAMIKHVGGNGMGHTMKLLNNMVGLGNLALLCEVFSIARKAGVNLEVAREILSAGSAHSKALEFWGERLIAEDYQRPTYRFDLAAKDVRLARTLASASGLPFPVFSGTDLLFTTASALGFRMEDVCVIKSLWDDLINRSGAQGSTAD